MNKRLNKHKEYNLANQWLYTVAGKKAGPASFGQLQEMVQSGQLKPTDLVQREGTRNWVAALTVEGLVPIPAKVESPKSPAARPSNEVFTKAGGLLQQHEAIKKGSQDPILTAVASLLLPPLGQLLLGQTIKAIALFLLFPVAFVVCSFINFMILPSVQICWLMIPAYCAAMAADAFLLGKKLRSGSAIGGWEFFAKWSPYE
jgi:TM2 domain-containing membrane protein YozV